MDLWTPPYSVKIIANAIGDDIIDKLLDMAKKAHFVKATQGVHVSPGKSMNVVQEEHKVRLDYTLTREECGVIDNVIPTSGSLCTLRERWRLLYYNGDDDKKAFRGPHTDWTAHSCHRRMSIVIGLVNPFEYSGGELRFTTNNLTCKLERGTAIIFDAKLVHEVLPVTSGKRYVIQSFMFDESGWALKKDQNNKSGFVLNLRIFTSSTDAPSRVASTDAPSRVLALLSTDGGPGNQVVGIKEFLMMALKLGMTAYVPPIFQHYVLNRKFRGSDKNIKRWPFFTIFRITHDFPIAASELHASLIREHPVYYVRRQDMNRKTRMEELLDIQPSDKRILNPRTFTKEADYLSLGQSITEPVTIINNLFNNTAISACSVNGCDTCILNPALQELYGVVCRSIDYSDFIKTFALAYIREKFKTEPFIAVHMRYPDYGGADIKAINGVYDEDDIDVLIRAVCGKSNIPSKNVFVATSNKQLTNRSAMSKYHQLPVLPEYDELESFIEQCICAFSHTFIYTGGIHAKPDHAHLRSTWASFVLDYRKYILNRTGSHIYLQHAFT